MLETLKLAYQHVLDTGLISTGRERSHRSWGMTRKRLSVKRERELGRRLAEYWHLDNCLSPILPHVTHVGRFPPYREGVGQPAIDPLYTMTINWTEAELAVITALAASQDLSPEHVVRQALRVYQMQVSGARIAAEFAKLKGRILDSNPEMGRYHGGCGVLD